MILRRITEHIKAQDWTALVLDFVIVVAGVLFALMAEQWLRAGQQRADLKSAEIAIDADLFTNLFSIREVLAVAPCRKERTKVLSQMLQTQNEPWPGLPWTPHPGAFQTQLPEVLPTPYRFWGSRAWDAEHANGTLSSMDGNRRRALDSLFRSMSLMLEKQEDIFDAQARLKVLAIPREISAADRSRYLELLHFHDLQSGLRERVARQTLASIEAVIPQPSKAYFDEFRDYMPTYAQERLERYGDCFVPFDMPYLNTAAPTEITDSKS
ncbi:MAG: hypothetical protein AAF197_06235 [Pseudomonadota bacterium]